MKKIMPIVLVLLVFCVSAFAADVPDIRFDAIDWLSDDAKVTDQLKQDGYIRKEAATVFSKENNVYIVKNDDASFYQSAVVNQYQDVCFSTKVNGLGRIAGYPLQDLTLTFAYNGSYQLISVQITLIGADYETLKAKLYRVYGKSVDFEDSDLGIYSNIWIGNNNSAVLLYTESDGLDYTLLYGRTDAISILSNSSLFDPDDISGL